MPSDTGLLETTLVNKACILESKLQDVNKFCQCAYLNGSFRSEIRDSGTPAVSGAGEMAAHGEVVNENYEVSYFCMGIF